MELIERSETLAFRTQTSGNYPKENILHKEHGESLKSRNNLVYSLYCYCDIALHVCSPIYVCPMLVSLNSVFLSVSV